MKKQKNYPSLFKKWIKTLLFNIVVFVITIFDFISMRVEMDDNYTITVAHEGYKIILKRFPSKSNITYFSDLEKMLVKRGQIPLPDNVIALLIDRYRFNKNFHNISIIATKRIDTLIVMKNNPGKGFKIVETPYEKTMDDLRNYLALMRAVNPRQYDGIYFPVSVTRLDVPEILTPYHPV